DEDGHPRELVGQWAEDKHALISRYVDISRGVRSKFLNVPPRAGATYVDLFCGSGRARIRASNRIIDGSPLVAWSKAKSGGAPFSEVVVADESEKLVEAAVARLRAAGAPVTFEIGPAADTVDRVLTRL